MTDFLTYFQEKDPIIHAVLVAKNQQALQPRTEKTLFQFLVSDIIGQQLSGKAADTIEARFRQLLPDQQVRPELVLALEDQAMRDSGLSWAKVKYVRNAAEHVVNGSLRLEDLPQLDDEAVITALTQVKGIGRWTAEMFLLFTLGRPNIYSHGDLGLKKGLMNLYNLPEYSVESADAITANWSPFKSYGSLALWHSLDNR